MVQQKAIFRELDNQCPEIKTLGHLVASISRLEQSIDELAWLLKEGYIHPAKEEKLRYLLEQRKTSRMHLRKTLLQLGGINYILPYWRIK